MLDRPVLRGLLPTLLCGVLLAAGLAALPTAPAHAAYAGENGRILYATGFSGSQIRSVCPDGSDNTYLAAGIYPDASPDGTRIAYSGVASGTTGVHIMDADGSNDVRLTTSEWDDAPKWSPDGEQLAVLTWVPWAGGGKQQLALMDPETGATTPLMPDRYYDSMYAASTIEWSPDGQWIYFQAAYNVSSYQQGNNLYRVNPMGGTPQLVFEGMGTYNFQGLDISPDGTEFVLKRQDIDANLLDQLLVPVGGGEPEVMWTDPAFNATETKSIESWSPDGTMFLAYHYLKEEGQTVGQAGIGPAELDGTILGYSVGGAALYSRWSTIDSSSCSGFEPPPSDLALQIDEVMLAAGGRDGASYVEVSDPAAGDVLETDEPYRLAVYDGTGKRVGVHTLDAAELAGSDEPWLVGTSAADAELGSSRDETLSVDLPATGQACLTTGADQTRRSCVTWGCVAEAVSSPATVAIAYPTATASSQRQGSTSSAFRVASPTPGATNLTGEKGTPSCGPALDLDGRPKVTGRAKVGGTLTAAGAAPAAWRPRAAEVDYAWLRGGKPIKGAHRATYRPKAADVGKRLSVRVTATRDGYPAGRATSAAVKVRGKAKGKGRH